MFAIKKIMRNYGQKSTCPLNRNCFQSSVIYEITIKHHDNNTSKTYIGLTENNFKRYRNHTASFHDENTETLPNFKSTVDLIFHYLTNVMNLYLLAATETKRCYVRNN